MQRSSERFDPAKPEHAALQRLLSDYTVWRDHGLPADLHILELFSIVLLSEVNRTYEYWYEPADEFPRTKFDAAHAAINARTDCGDLRASAKRYTDYLDDPGPTV